MNNMISIIITTYKRDISILGRAIYSALSQTYNPKEIIIVNDYFPNKAIIDDYINEKKINVLVIHNTTNMGACKSRNKGAACAKGSYIAFLDDDDEWLPNKLEKQMQLMTMNVSMVYCSGIGVNKDKTQIVLDFIHECHLNPLEEILKYNCIGGSSFPLLKKSSFFELGGFDSDFKSSQDYDLWIRIVSRYNIAFCNDLLVKYSIMDDSITSNFSNRIQGYNLLLSKHKELYKRYPRSASYFYANVIETCIKNKNIAQTYIFIYKSFSIFPYNIFIIKYILSHMVKKLKRKFISYIKTGRENNDCC